LEWLVLNAYSSPQLLVKVELDNRTGGCFFVDFSDAHVLKHQFFEFDSFPSYLVLMNNTEVGQLLPSLF
jgi:hypothetical protein